MEYQPAIKLIKKSNSVGITVYEKGGGDEIGSALAIASILKKQGKAVGFLFSGVIEEKWKNIFATKEEAEPGTGQKSEKTPKNFIIAINIKESPIEEIKYEIKGEKDLFIMLSPKLSPIKKEYIRLLESYPDYDCLITIGIRGPEYFGKEFEENPLLFYEKPIINLDVSPENENFGEINLVDITKSSLGELVYELIDAFDARTLGPREATRLLAGIIEKTDNFKNHRTTPKVLEIASRLLEAGADKESIIKSLYKTKPLNLLQLWGRASIRSRFDAARGILWTFLPKGDFEKTGTKTQDIHFVIEHMKEYFKSPKVHTLLFENPRKNHVRVIIRTVPPLIKEIAKIEPSEEKDGILLLKKDFPGFPEAESCVNNLIKSLDD